MIKVLHLDDVEEHSLFTAAQLARVSGEIELQRAASVRDAIDRLGAEGGFDCLLLDDENPDASAGDVLIRLRNSGFSIPAVVLTDVIDADEPRGTGSPDSDDALCAFVEFGDFSGLAETIKKLVEHSRLLRAEEDRREEICEALHTGVDEIERARNELTAREKEILTLVAQGLANKEIAGELFISERTVANHLANMFKKLEIHSRSEAVRLAFAMRLLEPH